MTNYEKPLTEVEVRKILTNSHERIVFFYEYPFFKEDGHRGFYQRFIIDTLKKSKSAELISDAIYLAIEIDFFALPLFHTIKSMLLSRRQYLVKLACLDYVNHFDQKIKKRDFLEINQYVLDRSSNALLKIQATTNLLPKFPFLFDGMIKELQKCDTPTAFYRALNGLQGSKKKLNNQQVIFFKDIIAEKNFKKSVVLELKQKIQTLAR